ncbi:uncharacterized protein LOC108882002 isoform X10 [Lates calcarifer]|uniref:Uncharacterized protein LOC108882002 isoform X10 n=1 Tax=Lates calcarifer TaxID=8187 RepID=A0AAJ8DUI9_LATCA|nr:uncharacterized protein LOC108882002 isoform X10 [Lates calcarifer]
MSFTIVTALLLSSFSWISISVSESQTVEVQSGEEATLLCSNFTTSPSQIIWFRLTNRTQPRCISSIYTATDPASLCSGVQEGKYEMRSNISTVFLKMKDVDSSDSGLYFCGYYISRHPVIVSATYLKVQGNDEPHDVEDSKCKEESGVIKLTCVILGGLSVLLVMVIIGLVLQNRKLQTADKEEQNPQQSETRVSDDVNYAAVTFQTKTKRRELETNVVYAATR